MKLYKIFYFIFSYLIHNPCIGKKNVEANMKTMKYGTGGVTTVTYAGITNVMLMNATRYSCHGEIYESGRSVRCTDVINSDLTATQIFCSQMPALQMNINKLIHVCLKSHPYTQVKMECQGTKCNCLGGTVKTLDELYKLCGPDYGSQGYLKYVYYPHRRDENHVPMPNKDVTCLEHSYKCSFYEELEQLNENELIHA